MRYGALLTNKTIIISIFIVAVAVFVIVYLNILSIKSDKKIESFNVSEYSEEIRKFGSVENVGEVPNSSKAKIVAETLWVKTYGEDIKRMRPYKVLFDSNNEVWLVQGTLPKNKLGGVPNILIQKRDGRVLAIWHTK